MNQEIHPPNTIPSLLQNLRDDTTTLLRQEVALAKAELGEKASHLGSQVAQIAIGGFVAYAGLIVLLFGLSELLALGLMRTDLSAEAALWLSRAIVGIVVALIGWAMFAKAKKAMSAENLRPEQTIRSLRENKQWAQTKLHHSHEPST